MEPAEGCDGSWERMRQMADEIRKEMREVRFGTKERRGTDYVKGVRDLQSRGMGLGEQADGGDRDMHGRRGSVPESIQSEPGAEEVPRAAVVAD